MILSGCLIINDNKELLLLHRKDHDHWETPGGKVEDTKEAIPTRKELRNNAIREVFEELGTDIMIAELEYFENVSFKAPNGKKAIAHKFFTWIIEGTPIIAEPETFDKLEYIPIDKLEEYPVSPDLKLFLPRLQELNKL